MREEMGSWLAKEFGQDAVVPTREGFAVTCEGTVWDFHADKYSIIPSVFREHVKHVRYASGKMAEEGRRG